MKQNINNSILENITTRLQRSKINKETIMHKKRKIIIQLQVKEIISGFCLLELVSGLGLPNAGYRVDC